MNYILKALIQHETLSLAMNDYMLSVEEIAKIINRLKIHAVAMEDRIDYSWAEDLTVAEETNQSPTIGRVRQFCNSWYDRWFTSLPPEV